MLLGDDERRRAERLCERLWSAQGTGRTYAEEVLLGLVGVQASPDSLPFFRAAVETSRDRDSFQARRRRIAVASVAFIARQTNDAAAHIQLAAWLGHPDVTVRTEAVALYGRVHLRKTGGLEKAALAVLEGLAHEERAFAPRFLARGWLQGSGRPVRIEPPDGVYAFKASLGRVSRTVELASTQSLFDLVSAILSAFEWDQDHLYEFALTGDLQDRRFILPPMEGTMNETLERGLMTLSLGALGLPRGHKFLFRFDFGDDHRFRVAVTDIQPQRSPGASYSRVVASSGEAPGQYSLFDE
ncbi:MAG TPA: hypothetical protein VE153_31970 [Myxococcus sp.]|nr:hypothetical protein [Myxococcus sp.]